MPNMKWRVTVGNASQDFETFALACMLTQRSFDVEKAGPGFAVTITRKAETIEPFPDKKPTELFDDTSKGDPNG